MTLFEFIKLLFTKLGDKESIKKFFDSLVKMPRFLKRLLIVVLILGLVYFGFSKIYTYELEKLKIELLDIKEKLSSNVTIDEYSSDIFYLMEAIKISESVTKYMHQQEQLQLQLIKNYIQKYHPNDPIIYDIESMENRNEVNFTYYDKEFFKILNNCKNRYKNELNNDTIKIIP